jgi:hypothetical protein
VIEVEKPFVDKFQQYLKMYRLRADVTMSTYALRGYFSTASASEEIKTELSSSSIFRDPRVDSLGYRILTEAAGIVTSSCHVHESRR